MNKKGDKDLCRVVYDILFKERITWQELRVLACYYTIYLRGASVMSNEITIFVGIERLQELHVVVLPAYQHSCKNKIMTKLEPVSRNIENCVSWPSESAAGRLVTRKAVLLLTVKIA